MRLTVENFSCLRHADIEFKRLTTLVGPQATGKSVIAKLNHFFIGIRQRVFYSIATGTDFESFKKSIEEDFLRSFPPSAWGKEKFDISFSAGDFISHLYRRSYRGEIKDEFTLNLPPEFKKIYEATLDAVRAKIDANKTEIGVNFTLQDEVARAVQADMIKLFGIDLIQGQLFVPAGRSFFTSAGKTVAAFEQSAVVDPLVIQFGRAFTTYTENDPYFAQITASRIPQFRNQASDLLGGEIIRDRDSHFVQTNDGRKIPFSVLSSGQQELLPLLLSLNVFGIALADMPRILYIEEPEAHLFPEAQSKLIELLALVLNSSSHIRMVITTHSPYVLAKINNLIKAKSVASLPSKQKAVEEVIRHEKWLNTEEVAAFAIRNSEVMPILDTDGLINADYLDSVSNQISQEFSQLLEIEFGDRK